MKNQRSAQSWERGPLCYVSKVFEVYLICDQEEEEILFEVTIFRAVRFGKRERRIWRIKGERDFVTF